VIVKENARGTVNRAGLIKVPRAGVLNPWMDVGLGLLGFKLAVGGDAFSVPAETLAKCTPGQCIPRKHNPVVDPRSGWLVVLAYWVGIYGCEP
jgi:hypothetical protein